jgi:hypothetical protein
LLCGVAGWRLVSLAGLLQQAKVAGPPRRPGGPDSEPLRTPHAAEDARPRRAQEAALPHTPLATTPRRAERLAATRAPASRRKTTMSSRTILALSGAAPRHKSARARRTVSATNSHLPFSRMRLASACLNQRDRRLEYCTSILHVGLLDAPLGVLRGVHPSFRGSHRRLRLASWATTVDVRARTQTRARTRAYTRMHTQRCRRASLPRSWRPREALTPTSSRSRSSFSGSAAWTSTATRTPRRKRDIMSGDSDFETGLVRALIHGPVSPPAARDRALRSVERCGVVQTRLHLQSQWASCSRHSSS